MKHSISSVGVALLLFASLASTAQGVEILRWERLPLAVPLVVGQERVIFIDRNVRVGVPAAVGERLRVQSAGGTLYLKAQDVIEPTRLQLQDADTGALILLDIAAEPAQEGRAPLEPVRIIEGPAADTRNGARAGATADAPRRQLETPIPVVLTRHAAQSLYAPLRTVEPVPGIGRVNLSRELGLDTLLPTLPIRPKALASWRLEDLWVTAVRLSNLSGRWIELDPRALQGDFVAATFQHPDMGPSGHASDTTVVYLVTRGRGLAGALLPSLSLIDATLNLPPSAAAGQMQGARDE